MPSDPPVPPGPADRPARAGRSRGAARPGRARPSAAGARPGPAGEGWDDGQGHRSAGTRPARPARAAGAGGLLSRLPRWALPAAGAVLVLLILAVVLVGRGGGAKDAGACFDELLPHLSADEGEILFGTDLVQARAAGYRDDASLEDLGKALEETGTLPDQLSARYRFSQLLTVEDFAARTGVEPGDMQCTLSTGPSAVFTGSFDPAEVKGSEVGAAGDLAATDDRLGFVSGGGSADPDDLLDEVKGGGLADDDEVVTVLRSLREDGAYTLVLQRATRAKAPAQVGAIGIGGSGDDRTLVVAYAFRTADDAKAGRADIVDRVNAAVQGTTSIASSDLEVDGNLVRAVVDARKAPDLRPIVTGRTPLLPSDS